MLLRPWNPRCFELLTVCSTALAAVLSADAAQGQIIKESDQPAAAEAVRYGTPVATRYRVGAKIAAKGATVTNIRLMVAVPLECPEQDVHVVEEDFSPHVAAVDFRLLPPDDGARQMLIAIPSLPARQSAHAYVTYEVVTKPILPPEDTAPLRAPKKVDRSLKQYLSGSPYIDVNHRKIRDAVREALAANGGETPAASDAEELASPGDEPQKDAEQAGTDAPPAAVERTDWQRVEALYDYAIKHVEYEEGVDKSSVQALKEGRGDCQAIAALFVAMCRTEDVPARLVWVDGHQYAEFYLEDEAGEGRWYPVESAGTRAFGEMPIARVILQKGDNFRVPERRGERLRYASDYALLLTQPGQQPKVTYVREQL